MAILNKIFLVAAALGLSCVAGWAQVPGYTADFGRMAVLEGGRVKPVDTVARAALMRMGGRTEAVDGATRLEASQWLWAMIRGQEGVDDLKVFRIDHPELKTLAGDVERKYFSYNELVKVFPTLAKAAAEIPADSRDPYDLQLGKLVKNLLHYYDLKGAFGPQGILAQELPPMDALAKFRVDYEYYYHFWDPLMMAQILYAVGLLAILLAGMGPKMAWAHKAAWGTLGLGLGLHLLGIASRMFIQERPPVTNLYSSALFVGAVAVIAGLWAERGMKNRLGLAVAALCGWGTLLISDKLAESGDTLEMMRAVLDSNFWLATHVVVVTIGYSAMFVAGGLAALYFICELLSKVSTQAERARAAGTVYAITCAALLFSFLGTMLGGIWADQSWGRFWGWDPKENGALMIVLWAAMILHARWGGLVKERGILVLAVGGNIITAWSWFGTNLMGVGLHSYGFTDSGLMALVLFVISQLVLMALGIGLSLKKNKA